MHAPGDEDRLVVEAAPAALQVECINPPFHRWAVPGSSSWALLYRQQGGVNLRFPGIADFLVSANGKQVTCTPVPGVSEASCRQLYLNQVLPAALSAQGMAVFHGSAVQVEDFCIAFVGVSGRGKSTLAAEFSRHGHPFLTDDGLYLEAAGTGYQVVPSSPALRLWEDSRQVLAAGGVVMDEQAQFTSKARLLAGSDLVHCDRPLPLRRVYFLEDNAPTHVVLEPMPAAQAMMAWVNNSFLLDIEDRARVAQHFQQVSRLARQPIHYRLDYTRNYAELGALRAQLVAHA